MKEKTQSKKNREQRVLVKIRGLKKELTGRLATPLRRAAEAPATAHFHHSAPSRRG
jgi:hypothetical protein